MCPKMVDMLYERLQRRGYLRRDIERMVNRDRNIFGSLLLKLGLADAMITGTTRTYSQSMREDPPRDRSCRGQDAVRHPRPGRSASHDLHGRYDGERAADPEMLADIAERTAQVARRMGHEPRVAFLSYSTFGNPPGSWLDNVREAVSILDGAQSRLRI
jgi:malate dehydrogenase (oxaloacetate-decarboxylating)(NADP+)